MHELVADFSVVSDVTTSHSTKLAKNASQVVGYVANRF
jgi:hypothetical protein